MTRDEALKIVTQVCVNYRGTLQEHQAIQTALQVIKDALEPKPEPEVTTVEEPNIQ
jgi:hypothetical protein